jgi:hypothetical protein
MHKSAKRSILHNFNFHFGVQKHAMMLINSSKVGQNLQVQKTFGFCTNMQKQIMRL